MAHQLSTKQAKIAYWTLNILIALPFVIFGGMKIVGADQMMNRMAEIHYSAAITRLIGIIEFITVIGLFLPKFRLASLFTFLLIMAGAVGSHIGGGHPLNTVVMPFLIAILILIGMYQTLKIQEWRIIPENLPAHVNEELHKHKEKA